MTQNDLQVKKNRAVLVGLWAHRLSVEENATEETVEELADLLETAGGECVGTVLQSKDSPDPRTFIGEGKVAEVRELVRAMDADMVIFDNSLSPSQQRVLSEELKVAVMDRSALILDIFAQRARTREGRLQVELAQYKYLLPRLLGMWTHLERQEGAIGTRGPGETQLETDRRHIHRKIAKLEDELRDVRRVRATQRSRREKNEVPVVAIVGYTNAGKSTLFNCLSSAGVFAENLLFATLDPTMRRIRLPGGREVILSDTVGFISDLPHELIMSFRATLEEVLEADVIVHVRDIANENSLAQKKDVLNVLKSLGLKNIENESGYIEVLNKIDLFDEAGRRYLEENAARNANVVPLSAVSGEGTERFLRLVEDKLSASFRMVEVTTDAADGKLISWIYKNTDVISAAAKGERMILRLKADDAAISKLKNKTPVRTLG